MNVRSIKNKVEQVKETGNPWLKDTDEDQAWVATSGLDNEDFRIDMVNQHMKREEG